VRHFPRLYTSQQVVEAERWAWASSSENGDPDFSFDGKLFWYRAEGTTRPVTVIGLVPKEGWWHAKDCHCELCRPSFLRYRGVSAAAEGRQMHQRGLLAEYEPLLE
jgi:hypothetical protein